MNVDPGQDLEWVLEPTLTPADYVGYSGTVHLVTPLGKGGAVNGGVQAGVDLSVQARVHECVKLLEGGTSAQEWVCLTISDPSTIITDRETITIYLHAKDGSARGGSTFSSELFLEFGCATDGVGMTGGAYIWPQLGLEPDPAHLDDEPPPEPFPMVTSLRRSSPGARLSGKFTLQGSSQNPHSPRPSWLNLEASFQLSPDATSVSCVAAGSCPGGLTCDPSGLCVRPHPSTGCYYGMTGGPGGTGEVNPLWHRGTGIGSQILDQVRTWPNSVHAGFYSDFTIWEDLYSLQDHSNRGLGQKGSVFRDTPEDVAKYPRLVAPDLLDSEMRMPNVRDAMAWALVSYALDIPAQIPGASVSLHEGWGEVSAQRWVDYVKGFLPGTGEAYVPCIDSDHPDPTGETPLPSIKEGTTWAADCGRYWENVKAVTLKSDDFRDECTGTDAWIYVGFPGTFGWYRVYACPGMARVLGGNSSATGSALVDSANRYLCQHGQGSAMTGLVANDIDADASVLARSGEPKCRDDYSSSGASTYYRPSGVDLLTLQDSTDQNETALPYSELMRKCISDLETGLTVPGLTNVDAPDMTKQWLDSVFIRRTCFSPAHFWAAFQTAKASLDSKDEAGQRYFFGLIKQWLQMHAFILTQGLEEHRLARTEEGNASIVTNLGDDSTDAEGKTKEAVPLAKLMDVAEAGLGLIVGEASQDASMAALQGSLKFPDWRPGPNVQNRADEQTVGVPVVLMETATKYLRATEEYLQEAALEGFAEVVGGVLPEKMVLAQRRAGFALRLTSLIEEIASSMNRVASGDVQACSAGSDCGGMSCSPQGVCYGTTWAPKYAAATNEYLRVQRDLAYMAQSQMNPLGIDESDLPLFFGDLTGTNSRFFASSDYLLNTWAVSAVQTAQAALDKARDAWVSRRNATIQDEMNKAEEERRIEGIRTKYGEIIAANCGLGTREEPVATTEVLDKAKAYFDPSGPRERCYINTKLKDADDVDLCIQAPSVQGGSDYEQCVADKTLEVMASHLEQMGFYKKDFQDPEVNVGGTPTKVTWACRNYFHLQPADTSNEAEVRVRVSAAPLDGMAQGISAFKWFRPDKKETRDGGVLSGCDVLNPGSYTSISSKAAASDDERNLLAVLRCKKSGGGVVCDRPTPADLQKDLRDSKVDENCLCVHVRKDVSTGILMGSGHDVDTHDPRWGSYDYLVRHSALTGLEKYFRCKGDALFSTCGGPETVFQWKQPAGGLQTCSNDNSEGIWLLAETSTGVVYRPCAQSECQSDDHSGTEWAYGADACGWRIPFGYGNQLWWGNNEHEGEDFCLKDAYRTETCSREAYELAAAQQMEHLPLSLDLTEAIDQACQNGQGVPSGMWSKSLTALPLPPECYLGQLGATVIKGYGALEDVELAKLAWGAAQESYDIQGRVCTQIQDDAAMMTARQEAFANQMTAWRTAKLVADSLAVAAANTSKSFTSLGASNAATGFQIASLAIETKMQNAQMQFDNFMRSMTLQQQVRECFAETNKLQAQFDVQKGQIIRRATDLAAAQQEFSRIMSDTERAYAEGLAALERELGRQTDAPRFEFHYWYEEKADRYLREFKWAKRLVYLAMRAVEYEFQQSLGLRKSILTAQHPDQLEGAVRAMQTEVATRAINRRRPQELSAVLSLRDDVLGIVDKSRFQGTGERKATPLRAFQDRLWDPRYSIYDKDGKWAGQGIPFTITPQGGLVDRCAERLWRVTATVQGDGLSDTQPGATLRLLKKNTFSSQWCEGKGDGSTMQVGQLQPSKSLFKDDPGPGVAGETNAYSTAAVYPWFNVRRSDFYKTTYQDGASEELAGRGLYGDYVLLFPAALLEGHEMPNPPPGQLQSTKVEQFPLDRVEDVLMRFDYLSVDNFASRGVQPNP